MVGVKTASYLDEGISSASENEQKPLSARQRAELNSKKRSALKKKQKKKKTRSTNVKQEHFVETVDDLDEGVDDEEDDVEVEYVAETPAEVLKDPIFQQFSKVFDSFKIKDGDADEDKPKGPLTYGWPLTEDVKPDAAPGTKAAIMAQIMKDEEENKTCPRPDVVEWHDVTSRDPKLLVYLKSLRNTVPVPRHWCFKRKYLAGKRGVERAPFQLPDFIRRTGIQEMREALREKEDHNSLKNRMREHVKPKLGRIDIDYQKLHDAFFRWQSKPKMTIHGDLYYEGKEFEASMREKKPGELSDDLRIALGMPIGPNANKFPPPWLIAMQRYGPAPSYPMLKVAGLNAPIPESCSFGYHAGGWGKPPVDEYGKPLYGDVFGIDSSGPHVSHGDDKFIAHTHWGDLDEEESEEEDSSEEEAEEGDGTGAPKADDADTTGMRTPNPEGLATPGGISTTTGVATPDSSIELRKRGKMSGTITEDGIDTPAAGSDAKASNITTQGQLYRVLPEKKVDRIANQMMASTHVYDLSTAAEKAAGYQHILRMQEWEAWGYKFWKHIFPYFLNSVRSDFGVRLGISAKKGAGATSGDIELSLNPDELGDLGEEGIKKKYEEQLRKQKGGGDEDEQDFSDMVAEHAARQKRKRKGPDDVKGGKSSTDTKKKQKDFKF